MKIFKSIIALFNHTAKIFFGAELFQELQINYQRDNAGYSEHSSDKAMNESYLYRKDSNEVENIKHNRSNDAVFQKPERQRNYFYQRENYYHANDRRN